jgi:hypothetical protein
MKSFFLTKQILARSRKQWVLCQPLPRTCHFVLYPLLSVILRMSGDLEHWMYWQSHVGQYRGKSMACDVRSNHPCTGQRRDVLPLKKVRDAAFTCNRAKSEVAAKRCQSKLLTALRPADNIAWSDYAALSAKHSNFRLTQGATLNQGILCIPKPHKLPFSCQMLSVISN